MMLCKSNRAVERGGVALCVFVLASVVACSSSDDGSPSADDVVNPKETPTESEGPEPAWDTLVTADWALEPGTEDYYCARKTLTEDTYFTAFRPLVADDPAVHHGFLTITPDQDPATSEPDGVAKCDGFTLGTVSLAGSSPGFGLTELPDGVAMKIEAGVQLLYNLHLYNTTTSPMSGTSGMEIVKIDASEVKEVAELVLAGKVPSLAVPPGESTQTGTCTVPGDVTVFAALPHMHRLGTYLNARLLPTSGEPVTILDQPYDFEEQGVTSFSEPIPLHQGDTVEVSCTYQNPGTETIPFGQSTDNEMCYAAMFWYPALSAGNFCYND